MSNVLPWILGGFGLMTLLAAVLFAIRIKKGGTPKRGGKPGEILFIGKRPSTGSGYVTWGKPVRGVFTWREKGDFEADIVFAPGFVWRGDTPFVEVDLDNMTIIRYDGQAENDDDVTLVLADGRFEDTPAEGLAARLAAKATPERPVVKKAIRGAWRRLGGAVLAQYRKDLRIRQINNSGGGWLEALARFVPVMIIMLIIIAVVILSVLLGVVL